MNIFREEKRFDPKTGKPSGTEKVFDRCVCDVCGLAIEEDKYVPELQILVDYGGIDACFGSGGDEYSFGERFNIDLNEFLSFPFVSHNCWTDPEGVEWDCDVMLAEEIKQSGNLPQAIRNLKIKTATMLIVSGKIKPNQLSAE